MSTTSPNRKIDETIDQTADKQDDTAQTEGTDEERAHVADPATSVTVDGITYTIHDPMFISHIELVAKDAAEAGAFYEKVFGWTITPTDKYTFFSCPSTKKGERFVNGGFDVVGDDRTVCTSEQTLVFIVSDDIDATEAKIVEAGGEIIKPKFPIIGDNNGWQNRFRDTQGNVLALWCPPDGEDGKPKMGDHSVGCICHVEFPTTDMDATVKFYNTVFNWDGFVYKDEYGMFMAKMEGVEHSVGGGFPLRKDWAPPAENEAAVVAVLFTSNIDATIERVKANGGKVITPKYGWDTMLFANVADPLGNNIGLYQDNKAGASTEGGESSSSST